MLKASEKFRNSGSRRFRQRIVLSGYLLSSMRGEFDPRHSCRDEIGEAVARVVGSKWKRLETRAKKVTDAARYHDEWWSLDREAQPATLKSYIHAGSNLKYLHGFDRLPSIDATSPHPCNYLLLLALSLQALEWKQSDRKFGIFRVRQARACSVLRAIRTRLKPDSDGVTNLPAFHVDGRYEWLHRVGSPPLQMRGITLDEFLSRAKVHSDPTSWVVSNELVHSYRTRDDIAVVDYLLALAIDKHPLPLSVLLRWAIDLLSATLATRCLVANEANHSNRQKSGDVPETLSFDAEGLEAIATFLLYDKPLDRRPLLRLIERLPSLDQGERTARMIWATVAFVHAGRLLRELLGYLCPPDLWFPLAWKNGQVDLPPAKPSAWAEVIQSAVDAARSRISWSGKIDALVEGLEPLAAREVRDQMPPPYGEKQRADIGAVDLTARVNEVCYVNSENARRMVERANRAGRMPTREEYLELLSNAENGRATMRGLLPGANPIELQKAILFALHPRHRNRGPGSPANRKKRK